MKARIEELLVRFTSRKFLLTAIGAFALYSQRQYGEMVVLLLGFVGVEGGADLVAKYKGRTLTARDIENTVSQNIVNIDDDPDTSRIVSGKPSPTPLFDEEPEEE